jgi:hypothetical protein
MYPCWRLCFRNLPHSNILPVTVTEADVLRDIQIHLPVNESDFLRREEQIRGARQHRPDRSFELETRGVLGGWERRSGIARTFLKKITVANYRQDPYYARIVKAVEGLLREKGFVAPLELFIRMDLLSPESVENWRRGRIAPLERAMHCNLAKAAESCVFCGCTRTIWISSPRSPSTNDGARALDPSYGFQRQATTILKTLTLVTSFLHVKALLEQE